MKRIAMSLMMLVALVGLAACTQNPGTASQSKASARAKSNADAAMTYSNPMAGYKPPIIRPGQSSAPAKAGSTK